MILILVYIYLLKKKVNKRNVRKILRNLTAKFKFNYFK